MSWCKGFSFPGRKKAFEIELDWVKDNWSICQLSFRWTRKIDHAGPEFNFNIFALDFRIVIYDTRHWYREKKRFFHSNEEETRVRRAEGYTDEELECNSENEHDG